MQLFALDDENSLIPASKAIKQKDYRCPECLSRVRARGGEARAVHYFHLDENRSCRQNGKSMQHLHAQFRLQQLIPDIILERPFPSISRIADAAWEKEKIVFEIQCSPITAQELRSRNRDYASLGWTPIWIFHQERYGKKKVTAAEWEVRRHPHYFTDIGEEGIGAFYAHLSKVQNGTRIKTEWKEDVDFRRPCRTRHWVHFEGDRWDELLTKNVSKYSAVQLLLQGVMLLKNNLKGVFYHFLEKACR